MAVIKNNSKGYNYNYATMSDAEKQGFKIPLMKTGTDKDTLKDYVWYFDEEKNEWFRGAEVVIPDAKGMNKAQLYGSALSYARRYTMFMALCLTGDDDVEIENLDEEGNRKKSTESKSGIFDEDIKKPKAEVVDPEKDKLLEEIYEKMSVSQIDFIQKKAGVKSLKEAPYDFLKSYMDTFNAREAKNEG